MIRHREDHRGPWYLFTGLLLGLALGLGISWGLSPVRYTDTAPSSLNADSKDQYRRLIAAAYQADGDLGRARTRLALLQDTDPLQALVAQAQRSMGSKESANEARSLALLAAALGQGTPPTYAAQAAKVSPTQTATLFATLTSLPSQTSFPTDTSVPTDTPSAAPSLEATSPAVPTAQGTASATVQTPSARRTATPSRTPSSTPGLPFVLARQSQVCDPLKSGLLQVQAQDRGGNPISGVPVTISWDGGQEVFFTGLKAGVNPGYADFHMTTGVTYTLRLEDNGELVSNLSDVECEDGSTRYAGGWSLIFTRP